jgi:RNA polymerase sigma-70 factor, ECF subfamily
VAFALSFAVALASAFDSALAFRFAVCLILAGTASPRHSHAAGTRENLLRLIALQERPLRPLCCHPEAILSEGPAVAFGLAVAFALALTFALPSRLETSRRAKVDWMRPEIERVVELLQENNPESAEEALALLQDTVFSFSMKVCGQRQDAEDTMQEVLLQSISKLARFDSPKALMVWLYKVAKTRCLMSRRKSKFAPKGALSLEELMPDRRELENLSGRADGTPETMLLRKENAKRLREAVQKLPPDYRLILVLHDMEELSDGDIAEITGLQLGTIRVRLHRARLFVRKELARQVPERVRRQGAKSSGAIAARPRERRCKEMFAELSDYLDDELDDSLCAELEKHMDGCEPCQAFLSSLEQSIQQCRTSANESPDPHAAAKLRRELMSQYQALMANVTKNDPAGIMRK